MKKLIKALFIFILVANCLSQEIKNNRLTVFGKVKVFTKADRANIIFHIKGLVLI